MNNGVLLFLGKLLTTKTSSKIKLETEILYSFLSDSFNLFLSYNEILYLPNIPIKYSFDFFSSHAHNFHQKARIVKYA